MAETRNILLLGRTGSGKSAIANVLLNKDGNFKEVFRESSGGISETRDLQIELLKINIDNSGEERVDYRIVDTVGVGDTKLTPQGVLYKLGKIAHELRDGLNQVLFVTKGRFTKEEAEAYDLLSSIIFDSEVVKYTTIVRTGFPGFRDGKKCDEDRQKLKEENPKFSHIFKSARKIIYVDNPPMEDYYLEIAKKVREESRDRLLTHLGGCQDTYHPSNLETLNKRIGEYMTNEEKLVKKMEELDRERKEAAEKFQKEIIELKEQQAKKLRENREKFDKDINDVREKSKEDLQKLKDDLEKKQKEETIENERKNEARMKELKDSYEREARSIKKASEKQINCLQEQSKQARENEEKLLKEVREKNTSVSEITSALTQFNLSNKGNDSNGEWRVRLKELESADLRAQQAHEARMQELKNQQRENQQQVSRQTETYIEERAMRGNLISSALAGGGALVGGPLGAGAGWLAGKIVNKLLS